MNKTEISLRYARGLVMPTHAREQGGVQGGIHQASATLSLEMMRLGFIPSQELMNAFSDLSEKNITTVFNNVIPALQKLVGADVVYTPMYPNFPQQVMEMSEIELFVNAIVHYWTSGYWKPEYDELPRELALEGTEFTEVGIITEEQFTDIFRRILASNDSISDVDKRTIKWFVDGRAILPTPSEIPYKENLCYVAGLLAEKGHSFRGFPKTTTDVLRVATYLSGGDISLAENTRFKSFPRRLRRDLCGCLNDVVRLEDLNRHRGKWIRLAHSLHVGEYSDKLRHVFEKLRSGKNIMTTNGMIEEALSKKRISEAVELLSHRPGDFARRMDHLLRLAGECKTHGARSGIHEGIINTFLGVADKVSTRVLLQLLGSVRSRTNGEKNRVIFPKGNTQKAIALPPLPAIRITDSNLAILHEGILDVLDARFSELDTLGNTWVDPNLESCPLPTQQRSASEGLFQVARGTQLPMGDKGTLRFFIYWKGRDIDLSATLHNDKFETMKHISFTHLKDGDLEACHSGDIVNAPNGAAEFIDITIDPAIKMNIRYVSMNVLVFGGPTFAEHEICYAGWMTRDKPNANAIFDPKTVEQKIDLRSNTKNVIPVVFDLVERKAIWVDVTIPRGHWGTYENGRRYRGNTVESTKASIEQVLESILDVKNNRVSLYDLFLMHGRARGEIVTEREEAETCFDLDSVYDITTINSEFMV